MRRRSPVRKFFIIWLGAQPAWSQSVLRACSAATMLETVLGDGGPPASSHASRSSPSTGPSVMSASHRLMMRSPSAVMGQSVENGTPGSSWSRQRVCGCSIQRRSRSSQ